MEVFDLSQVQRVPLSCDKKLIACVDYAKNHLGVEAIIVFMVLAFIVGFALGGGFRCIKKP